jgi:hypothetical protein
LGIDLADGAAALLMDLLLDLSRHAVAGRPSWLCG